MCHRAIFGFLVLLCPAPAAFAQGTERYLPAGSQIVVQVDSHLKTKPAYDRTAMGKMMEGETGKFLDALLAWAVESGKAAAEFHGQPTKEDVALIEDGISAIRRMSREGLALGIEMNQVWPPDGRAVVVLPTLSVGQSNMPKLIDDLRGKARGIGGGDGDIKDEKIAGRNVSIANLPIGAIAWWSQGEDFILTIGTGPVADYIKLIDAKKTGLADNAAYKKLLEIGHFPIRSRAYVDLPALGKLADRQSQEAGRTFDELGLRGLGPVLSVAGYDGPALRTVTEVETIGARVGLVATLSKTSFSLDDLPPLPSDLTTFTASNTNVGDFTAVLMDVGERIGKIYSPEQVDNVKAGIKGWEDIIGVDLRKDLFASFGDLSVQYASPAEGPLGMGGAVLMKVKDEAKLKKALASVAAGIPALPGVEAGLKKRVYRGVEVFDFHAGGSGVSYCVHKGYLVYANYPQPIHGYILRAEGVLPTWKADDRLTKALAAFPKNFTAMTFSDPRPMVQTAIATAPPILSIANGLTALVPGMKTFDVSQIPHAQEATLNLFPNVSVGFDDGKTLRFEGRASFGW